MTWNSSNPQPQPKWMDVFWAALISAGIVFATVRVALTEPSWY